MIVAAPPRPAYLWVPEGSTTAAGEEVADLALALGFDVDGPERQTLNTLMAESPSGSWAGLEAAVICGRQNLKTWALEMTVIYDAWVRNVQRVVWTSHRFKTTQSAFEDINQMISAHAWLSKSVTKVRTANGEEGFELSNGARIDFLARTSGGGRGLTGDTVILDEALFLQPVMMGALLPTLSARPEPHVRYGSSPGLPESGVLRSIRDRGRAGGDPSLSYIEFTSPTGSCADPDCRHFLGSQGCLLDDEERWAQANPALGRRISVEYVRQERRALSSDPVEFARERMGWWQDPANGDESAVYPLEDWHLGTDPESSIPDGAPVAWAVDVSWDRALAYVSVAGYRGDELVHGQVVHQCDPSAVADYLGSRVRRFSSVGVALQGAGAPVSSLLDDITHAVDGSCPILAMSGADVSKAYGAMFDLIRSGRFRHVADPSLDRAVMLAVTRSLGDGSALDRKKSPIDIANLQSLTNAVHLLLTTEDLGDPGVYFL